MLTAHTLSCLIDIFVPGCLNAMGSLYSFALNLFHIHSKPGAHLQTYFAVITSHEMTVSCILMQASLRRLQQVTDFFSPF